MDQSDASNSSRSKLRRVDWLLVCIVVLAFLIRALYVVEAKVDDPIRGDINQYTLYAWNLVNHGTFSTALPGENVIPDSYRGPGYPFLLALNMAISGRPDLSLAANAEGRLKLGSPTDSWIQLTLFEQTVLGAATVWLSMAIARYWLTRRWTLLVGLVIGLWPHLIVFAGTLLIETLFGFFIALSIWLTARGAKCTATTAMLPAGFSFALTYLINPIILFFVPFVAFLLFVFLKKRKVSTILFVGVFLLAPIAWSVRNALHVEHSGELTRLEEVFVDGSWPECHIASSTRFIDPMSARIMDEIHHEISVMAASPALGFATIFERVKEDPAYYLIWYFFEKPYSLWDWGIHIGAGDIYFLPATHSPFEIIPVLRWVHWTFRVLNPFIFGLALFGLLFFFWTGAYRVENNFGLVVVVGFLIYVTLLHTVLDAEPRYAVAYRPEEVLLAVTAMAWLTQKIFALTRIPNRRFYLDRRN